ncbi:hypothetical protein CVO77_17220 [Sphingopyxis lindanitolerans]|uniref:RES domain-containing protein n=1 Tax=Sphingopyxis lindanitolerans TaxID=2054227 RepID=A0A2S8B2W7_9SPHN|nr:RES family NAD+ phosphorylase [Sphingopyxis lindanitolerans]PQM26742.1 hypothetical protein CVO77_17220 [Sphingopyxis lindanitolerans]
MPDAPLSPVDWPSAVRLIESKYPPIDLFEDLADPEDWELLAAAEARTNPRISETIGNLDLVPVERRVSGPGASYVMAPFTHCSPDRPGRFHDGSFGAYYAASDFETAVAEVTYHQAQRLADTRDEPGWISDMRELVGAVNSEFVDVRGDGFKALLAPNDYAPSQAFAHQRRDDGANGIVYPSVRDPGGECIAAFWPDVVSKPVQARHFRYHWDGARIDMIHELRLDGKGPIFRLEA